MRLIDADALSKAMYDEAFENDESYNETNPMARWDSGLWIRYKMFENAIDEQPTIEPKQGEWIPVKWHEITDKEREEEGYPEGWSVFIYSVMPNDGERILVTTKHGEVEIDTCCEDDGFYLDSGWDWVDDIVAWMPLPDPWEGPDDE